MSRSWPYIENIALLAAMCFLVWSTGSNWWVLLMLFCNTSRDKRKAKSSTDAQD